MAQSVLGTATSQACSTWWKRMLRRQTAAGLDDIHRALDAGSDPRQFARQVVDYLRGLLLVRMGNADQVDATAEMRQQMARHAQQLDVPELLRLMRLVQPGRQRAAQRWQPGCPWRWPSQKHGAQAPTAEGSTTR